jgi:hypothetical protein
MSVVTDTKNSVGLVGCIEEVAHNAIAVYWNPLESSAKVRTPETSIHVTSFNAIPIPAVPLPLIPLPRPRPPPADRPTRPVESAAPVYRAARYRNRKADSIAALPPRCTA